MFVDRIRHTLIFVYTYIGTSRRITEILRDVIPVRRNARTASARQGIVIDQSMYTVELTFFCLFLFFFFYSQRYSKKNIARYPLVFELRVGEGEMKI